MPEGVLISFRGLGLLSICPTGHSVDRKHYFEGIVLQNLEK